VNNACISILRCLGANSFIKRLFFSPVNEEKLPSVEEKRPDALEMAAKAHEERKAQT
jgi:hypothetical protein